MFVLLLGLIPLTLFLGLHKINEGHIGLYWRGGALISGYTEPGYRLRFPFITQYENVQVTVQTDVVEQIPCGTAGGVMIYFDKIEVVNRLKKDKAWETVKNYTTLYDKTWIYDKIHHEINQFCSSHSLHEVYITQFDTLDESLVDALQRDCNKWAPGIEDIVIAVRVTKPRIPPNILKNYENIEIEKTNFLKSVETQKVIQKQRDTEQIEKVIQEETESKIAKIAKERQIMEKEALKKIQLIENEIYFEKEKGVIDTEYYKMKKEIEVFKEKLTPEYLRYLAITSLSNNTKLFFGTSIPTYISENLLTDPK